MSDIAHREEYSNLISSIQVLENELAGLVLERDELIYHVCPKI